MTHNEKIELYLKDLPSIVAEYYESCLIQKGEKRHMTTRTESTQRVQRLHKEFMQYHKKLIDLLNNNLGFYVGCLMWAAYFQTQPKQEILSNHCFGLEYDENANISDTKFMLGFTELFPKDMKYFLNQTYSFDENILKLIQVYEEFLIINKGFVESKYSTDIKLPEAVKTDNAESFKSKIDDVLKTKDLNKLLEYLPEIL